MQLLTIAGSCADNCQQLCRQLSAVVLAIVSNRKEVHLFTIMLYIQ